MSNLQEAFNKEIVENLATRLRRRKVVHSLAGTDAS